MTSLGEAITLEEYLGNEKMVVPKDARKDIRTILAVCNGIQAYLKPQEPDAKKTSIAKYKDGTKSWVESDGIKVDEELVKFLEKAA
jgi:hypothetical protein